MHRGDLNLKHDSVRMSFFYGCNSLTLAIFAIYRRPVLARKRPVSLILTLNGDLPHVGR